jgi:Ser/Thr protein kinase RdoA (MazF antagonist)
MKVKSIEFLTEETNTYFKVTTEDDIPYALKIYHEGSSTYEDNKAEIYFINRLKGVHTPHAALNKSGEGITLVENEKEDSPIRMALYSWLDGTDHYGKESPETFRKLGRQAALIHQQTACWELPKEIKIKKWDKVFYYTGEEAVYMKDDYRHIVDEKDCAMLDKLVPILDQKLSVFYSRQNPQLLHGDLNPWNVKFKNGEIRIFDFEDSLLGYPVHELSIILYFYRHAEGLNYEELKNALLEGYQSIDPKAEFSNAALELLILARELTFMNYSLLFDDEPKTYATICLNRIKEALSKQDSIKIN